MLKLSKHNIEGQREVTKAYVNGEEKMSHTELAWSQALPAFVTTFVCNLPARWAKERGLPPIAVGFGAMQRGPMLSHHSISTAPYVAQFIMSNSYYTNDEICTCFAVLI